MTSSNLVKMLHASIENAPRHTNNKQITFFANIWFEWFKSCRWFHLISRDSFPFLYRCFNQSRSLCCKSEGKSDGVSVSFCSAASFLRVGFLRRQLLTAAFLCDQTLDSMLHFCHHPPSLPPVHFMHCTLSFLPEHLSYFPACPYPLSISASVITVRPPLLHTATLGRCTREM